MSLVSFPGWSETLTMDDLVERNDLFYKKFNIESFTGEVFGIINGKIKKGKKVGRWIYYYSSGHPKEIRYYKNSKQHDRSEWFDKNGQFTGKGNFKDGKEEGLWEFYDEDGQLRLEVNFKNGVQVSD